MCLLKVKIGLFRKIGCLYLRLKVKYCFRTKYEVESVLYNFIKCHLVCNLWTKWDNNNNNNSSQSLLENLGTFRSSLEFLRELGRRSGSLSGEEREACFLFQRLSIAKQRFNSVLLHNGFTDDIPDL